MGVGGVGISTRTTVLSAAKENDLSSSTYLVPGSCEKKYLSQATVNKVVELF